MDYDWATDPLDKKWTSGIFFFFFTGVQFDSVDKRQTCLAMSSAESEHISTARAAQEITWLINLLIELDMPQQLSIALMDDKQSAIKHAESDKFHPKHIELRYHLLRHLVDKQIIKLSYINTDLMTADLLTKPLPKTTFVIHRTTIMNN